ncbi:MAG TPA: hypothetical protein PKZ07_18575 [Sedimentisphaerales bacterium]|nr:hypothetical protein [Sedimentisphaerales bacterium]
MSDYIETDRMASVAVHGDIKWLLMSFLEPMLNKMLRKSSEHYRSIYHNREHNTVDVFRNQTTRIRHLIYNIILEGSRILFYGRIIIGRTFAELGNHHFYGVYDGITIVVKYSWSTEYFRNIFVYDLRHLRYVPPDKMPFLNVHVCYLEQARQHIPRICQDQSGDSNDDLARVFGGGYDADAESIPSSEPSEGGIEIEDSSREDG